MNSRQMTEGLPIPPMDSFELSSTVRKTSPKAPIDLSALSRGERGDDEKIDESKYRGKGIDSLPLDFVCHFKVGGDEFRNAVDFSPAPGVKYWELEKLFFEWKKQYPGALLMVENGYKYECFSHDAKLVSAILGVRATTKAGKLLKTLLPCERLDVYLRAFVERGILVCVIQQIKTGKHREKSEKLIKREPSGMFSIGTLFASHVSLGSRAEHSSSSGETKEEEFSSRFIACLHEVPLDSNFGKAKRVEMTDFGLHENIQKIQRKCRSNKPRRGGFIFRQTMRLQV